MNVELHGDGRCSSRLSGVLGSPWFRWGSLSFFFAIYVWAQAMNHYSSEYQVLHHKTADKTSVGGSTIKESSVNAAQISESAPNTSTTAAAIVADAPSKSKMSIPQVVWLMSFPNSVST